MAVPVHFGDKDAPLYGVFHPAANASAALLICSAPGYEFMRSHRALKTLADKSAKKGTAVLRFDYRGVGQSAGALEDMRISDWIEDIQIAFKELQSLSGTKYVHVLGVRLGALLAMQALADIDGVQFSLWDPVVDGTEFFEAHIAQELVLTAEKDPYLAPARVADDSLSGSTSFLGYLFSDVLLSELKSLKLERLIGTVPSVTIYRGGDQQVPNLNANSKIEIVRVTAPDNWAEIDNFGSVILPQEMIRTISDRICKR